MKHFTRCGLLLFLILCISIQSNSQPGGGEPTIDMLVASLTSADNQARVQARLLLPRQGVAAIPALIPLLEHNDGFVAKAALNILDDIAHLTVKSANPEDRQIASNYFMNLLQTSGVERTRWQALSLLEKSVPAGYDLSPLLDLLKNEQIQERIRTALQRINTYESRLVLRDALQDVPPTFQAALLTSLGEMMDPESLTVIEGFAASENNQVRISALYALAWTGQPTYQALYENAMAQLEGEERRQAVNAFLRYLEAMYSNGGNWDLVVHHYRQLIADESGPTLQAAITGLARIGDETCVSPIIEVLEKSDLETQSIAVQALVDMKGRNISKVLVESSDSIPESVLPILISGMGKRGEKELFPVILAASQSSNPILKRSALNALLEGGFEDGIEPLNQAYDKGDEETKGMILAGLPGLAQKLRASGKNEAAGKVYLSILQKTSDVGTRKIALLGIASNPTPEAYEDLKPLLSDPDLSNEVTSALGAMSGVLLASGKKEQAAEAFNLLRKLKLSSGDIQKMISEAEKFQSEVDLASVLGLMTKWNLVGPFSVGNADVAWNQDFIDPLKVDPTIPVKDGNETRNWKNVHTQSDVAMVSLMSEIGSYERTCAYAYTEIEVPTEMDAQFLLGSDDGIKVWLNGELVWDNHVDRGMIPDQDKVPVKLKAGVNRILLKIWQNGGGWAYCMRMVDKDGLPIEYKSKF